VHREPFTCITLRACSAPGRARTVCVHPKYNRIYLVISLPKNTVLALCTRWTQAQAQLGCLHAIIIGVCQGIDPFSAYKLWPHSSSTFQAQSQQQQEGKRQTPSPPETSVQQVNFGPPALVAEHSFFGLPALVAEHSQFWPSCVGSPQSSPQFRPSCFGSRASSAQ
jgi:hypothetical protein